MKDKKAFQVGVIIGAVFIIMYLLFNNSSIWILGIIMILIGLAGHLRKKKSDK